MPGSTPLFIARIAVAALLLILVPFGQSAAGRNDAKVAGKDDVKSAWFSYKACRAIQKELIAESKRLRKKANRAAQIITGSNVGFLVEKLSPETLRPLFTGEAANRHRDKLRREYYDALEEFTSMSGLIPTGEMSCDHAHQKYTTALAEYLTNLALFGPQPEPGASVPPVKTSRSPPPTKRRTGPVKTTRRPQGNSSTDSSRAAAEIGNLLGLAIQAYGTSQGSQRQRSGGKPPSGGGVKSSGGRPCGGRCTGVINLPNGSQKRQYCIITTNKCGWYGYGRRRGPVATPLVR